MNRVLSEYKEVRNEEAPVETIGELENRQGDRRLAVSCRGQPKKRTQVDSGSRQNLAAAQIRLTCRFIPALRKGSIHRGADKTTDNDIRERSRRQELRQESKQTLHEALGQSLELEVVK
jgi:hypothetical protein